MSSRTGVSFILVLGLACAPALADVWVSTQGNDTSGDGTEGNPYRTIQHAVDNHSNETIRVESGTYAECVVTGNRRVDIVSEEFLDGGTNTGTIINGAGVCNQQGNEASTVDLGNGSRLRGFTVRGGGLGGISGFGSVVITNNLITGNSADVGGGVYVASTGTYADTADAIVANNRITQNTAAYYGGGVYVISTAVDGLVRNVRVEDNEIVDNEAVGFGGGLLVFSSTGTDGDTDIAVTRNLIEDNSVTDPNGAYGGGLYALTNGYGDERMTIEDNTVRSNTSAFSAAGMSINVRTVLAPGGHDMAVRDNIVASNRADQDAGGADLYLEVSDLWPGSAFALEFDGNLVENNVADGSAGSSADGVGGGIVATLFTQRSERDKIRFEIENNTIRNNDTTLGGGGLAIWVGGEADPDAGSQISPASATMDVHGNLIVGNESRNTEFADGVAGGVLAALHARGPGDVEVDFDRNTISDNVADSFSGGIEIESWTILDTDGTEGTGSVDVRNTIVSGNTGIGMGGPLPGQDAGVFNPWDPNTQTPLPGTGNITVDVEYSDVVDNTLGNYESWIIDRTGSDGNISVDPMFDGSYAPDTCSATIDAGDPAGEFVNEPPPNGGRMNMGYLAGTDHAVPRLADITGDAFVDGVDILRIAGSFGAAAADAEYLAAADVDENGIIDGIDLAAVASDFGTSCP